MRMACAALSVLVVLVAACSSVPDVRFVDEFQDAASPAERADASDAATDSRVATRAASPDASGCHGSGVKCGSSSECCSGICQENSNGSNNGGAVKRCG